MDFFKGDLETHKTSKKPLVSLFFLLCLILLILLPHCCGLDLTHALHLFVHRHNRSFPSSSNKCSTWKRGMKCMDIQRQVIALRELQTP